VKLILLLLKSKFFCSCWMDWNICNLINILEEVKKLKLPACFVNNCDSTMNWSKCTMPSWRQCQRGNFDKAIMLVGENEIINIISPECQTSCYRIGLQNRFWFCYDYWLIKTQLFVHYRLAESGCSLSNSTWISDYQVFLSNNC